MMAEEIFDGIQRCIDSQCLYVDGAEYFQLLQDPGTDVTEKQRGEIDAKLAEKKKKPKTFTHMIQHDYKLHPHLYTLASILHKKWFEYKDVHFADLPKQETTTIHMIGQYIAGHRRLYKSADYPAWAESDSTNNDIAKDQDQMQYASGLYSAYLLSQTDLLKHFKCKWGQSLPDVMKPTIDDKVRVAMLLFDDEIRDFVPDILSRKKAAPNGSNNNNNRANLDASNPRKKRGKLLLFNAFKDPAVIAKLPVSWTAASSYIDSKKGVGVFDEHGQFDPNNESRIGLPWTEKSVDMVFKVFLREFTAASNLWTMGTGGGPGMPEDFVVWQERDPLDFCTYSRQDSQLYLTPVYMLDKEYGFILVAPKESLPLGCQVEDADGNIKTPSTSKKSVSDDQILAQFTEQVQALSAARGLQTKELQDVLNGRGGFEDDAEDIVIQIERTTQLVDSYEAKTSKLESDKVRILNGEGS
jgi:hypothetical protein